MAGFLNFLQQSLSDLDPETLGGDINVTGSQPSQPMENDPAPMPMGNRSFLEEAQAALGNAPERKGMFGVKGTLRDILGTLGDAFLVQGGGKEAYRPRRDQENQMDALGGFTQNPMAAIERLSQTPGGVEQAIKMFEQQQANEARQGQLRSVDAGRQDLIADRDYKRKQDFSNYAARMLNFADTPEKQAVAIDLITKRAQALGLDVNELIPTEGMTDVQRGLLGAGDMTVNQQQQIPLRQQQMGIAQQNADANTTRANRPPQGRAPSEAEVVQSIIDKEESGATLTAGEKARAKKFTEGTGKKGSVLRELLEGAPSSRPQGSTGFRIVGSRPKSTTPMAQ